jgi:CBS domain-containing protein
MRPNIVTLSKGANRQTAIDALRVEGEIGPQRLFPVVDDSRHLTGVITRGDLEKAVNVSGADGQINVDRIIRPAPTVAYADEPLRVIVQRMAETGLTRFPIVERGDSRKLGGIIALDDLLKARALNLEAERRRERVLTMSFAFPFAFGKDRPQEPD